MNCIISGVIGIFVGGTVGAIAMAMCVASGKASRAEEAQYGVSYNR